MAVQPYTAGILDTYAGNLGYTGGRTFSEQWGYGITSQWYPYIASAGSGGGSWGTSWDTGSGNFGLETYPTNYSSNLTIVNGALNINAISSGGSWTSGGMSSWPSYQTPTNSTTLISWYAKMPDCRTGMWPGLWTLPGPSAGYSNTGDKCEYDVFEGGYYEDSNSSNTTNVNTVMAVHQQNKVTGITYAPPGSAYPIVSDMSANYHMFGLAFNPGVSVTYYFDGQVVWSNNVGVQSFPMEILMNLQVANGNTTGWHTQVSGSTPSPSTMIVQDVACFTLGQGGGGGGGGGGGTTGGLATIVQQGDTGLTNSGTAVIPTHAGVTIANVATGDSVLLNFFIDANDTISTVTSTFGVFTKVQAALVSFVGDLEQWFCGNCSGGGNQITVTTVSGSQYACQIDEFSGAGTATAAGTATPTSASPALTVTPTSRGEAVGVFIISAGAMTTGPASPWLDYNSGSWTVAGGEDFAWLAATSTAAVTATWTQSSTEAGLLGVLIQTGATTAVTAEGLGTFGGTATATGPATATSTYTFGGAGNSTKVATATSTYTFGGGTKQVENLTATTATGTNGYAVLPSTEYTAIVSLLAATVARDFTVGINWYDSSGSAIATSSSAQVLDSTTAQVSNSIAATSPSNAAYAAIIVTVLSTQTGETHWMQKAGLFFGSVTNWGPGGLSTVQAVIVQRSDGLYVRYASISNPDPLPYPSGQLDVLDYEAVPTVAYTYSVTLIVLGPGANQALLSPAAVSNSITLTTTEWWEIDPTNYATAASAQFISWNPQVTEQSTAHIVMGQAPPNIVANVMGGMDGAGTFETFSPAVYAAIQSLLQSQKTIFVSSPWGPIDSGYVRFGPQTGGTSGGSGTQVRNTKLLPSVAVGAHRTTDITFVAQFRPAV